MSDNSKNAIIFGLTGFIVLMSFCIGILGGKYDGERELVRDKQTQNDKLQEQVNHNDMKFTDCMKQLVKK